VYVQQPTVYVQQPTVYVQQPACGESVAGLYVSQQNDLDVDNLDFEHHRFMTCESDTSAPQITN